MLNDSRGWAFIEQLVKAKGKLLEKGFKVNEMVLICSEAELYECLATCREDEIENLGREIREKGISDALMRDNGKRTLYGIRVQFSTFVPQGEAQLTVNVQETLIL